MLKIRKKIVVIVNNKYGRILATIFNKLIDDNTINYITYILCVYTIRY